MSLSATAEALAARVDAEMRRGVAAHTMPLYEMMTYHLGWKDGPRVPDAGSRLRGVLCLMACAAAGGEAETALPAAAAVELLHAFSQVHDDVQGGNPTRDNRDAVWWVWGPAQAINAGDGMHALARLALFGLLDRGVPADRVSVALRALDEAALELCEGRFLDLEARERLNLTVDEHLRMLSQRAGSLISCSTRLGGLVAGANGDTVEALASFGAHLGIGMQVRAELEALWPAAGDAPNIEVLNKAKPLPIVHAWEVAGPGQKRRLADIYVRRVLQPADVEALRALADELGARTFCEAKASELAAAALAALDTARLSPEGAANLRQVVESLLG